jgi:uroporphyrinogen III methyltransferase / synthase
MQPEILVIREKDRFSSILFEQGFSVINFPTIKTEPLSDLSELEKLLGEIENFDGIFITSVKAAEIVLRKLKEANKIFRGKFYVLGKRSAEILKETDSEIFFDERATNAEELLELIPADELNVKRFLFPRGNRSLRVIPEKLKGIAEVCEVIVYKTMATQAGGKQSDEISRKIKNGEFAAVCFFSPSGVEEFLKIFPDFSKGKIKIAAIGKTTAQCIEENNFRADFISLKPSAEDFALELIKYLKEELTATVN